MPQTDTKTRILNAAEQRFARDGYHMTSLRTLTEQAKVNLAAVNYHFGSKEGLLKAVIDRRLHPLNDLRQKKIEAILTIAASSKGLPQARELLIAFIKPTLDFRNSGAGAEDFIALVGRSLSEPDETVRNCFIEQVLPIFRLLYDSLHKALPELPASILMIRLQFIMGAMSHMMCSGSQRVKLIPGFPEPLSDEQMIEELVNFVTAGLEAPC